MPEGTSGPWPQLPGTPVWIDTLETLHLWTQVVGKIRMVQSPWMNHSWERAPLRLANRTADLAGAV
jgi:hypothetical protein